MCTSPRDVNHTLQVVYHPKMTDRIHTYFSRRHQVKTSVVLLTLKRGHSEAEALTAYLLGIYRGSLLTYYTELNRVGSALELDVEATTECAQSLELAAKNGTLTDFYDVTAQFVSVIEATLKYAKEPLLTPKIKVEVTALRGALADVYRSHFDRVMAPHYKRWDAAATAYHVIQGQSLAALATSLG